MDQVCFRSREDTPAAKTSSVRSPRTRHPSRPQRPPDPKPDAEIAPEHGVVVAAGWPDAARALAPGAAAHGAVRAVAVEPRRAVGGRALIIPVVAILQHLPDVAAH